MYGKEQAQYVAAQEAYMYVRRVFVLDQLAPRTLELHSKLKNDDEREVGYWLYWPSSSASRAHKRRVIKYRLFQVLTKNEHS